MPLPRHFQWYLTLPQGLETPALSKGGKYTKLQTLRWQKYVVSCIKGLRKVFRFLPTGTVGEFGIGWVWNKEWVIKVECDDATTIPTCILACWDMWRIKYLGAPPPRVSCAWMLLIGMNHIADLADSGFYGSKHTKWLLLTRSRAK